MTLNELVATVSETLKSTFPEHGTLGELQTAADAAVAAVLGEFESPVEFYVRYPETLGDRAFIENAGYTISPTMGDRIDQLASWSLRKQLLAVERELLLNSFTYGIHGAAWDCLDASVRCAAGQKLGLLDSEDVKDTRLLFVCDGKVGKYFGSIAISMNRMMGACLYPENFEVSPLWSQQVAKRVGGMDKARVMFDITSKFMELERTGRDHFARSLEEAAATAPSRSLA
jgi:hypothetical protein